MRPQKVLDLEVLTGLARVFRARGYEGASLKELAEATGLKKASLYHRFPGGKQQMAEAVFNHIGEWVEAHIFQPLEEEQYAPKVRLKNGIAGIKALYSGGKEVCIFRALSMQAGLELFEKQLSSGMKQWIAAFQKIGLELGLTTAKAKEQALQTLIEIQGGLIVTKGLDDIQIFEKTLKKIEKRYLGK